MRKNLTKRQWWLVGLAGLAITLIAGLTVSYINRPQNIGPNLEYLGEINTGCSWEMGLITFGLCGDMRSNHAYIFATDLNGEELGFYFKNADKIDTLSGLDSDIDLAFQKDGKTALALYYHDAQAFLAAQTTSLKTQKRLFHC